MNKIELLAPAGSLDALKAAVENGADAVYIGGEQFSARQKADNFTREQMEEGIAYAHARGCKVHVAVNTLISNEEIGNLIAYAYQLAELGVDAVIVQDLGAAHILRESLPQLALHASTQMAVHNTPGVQFLENQGFERVVLARETSLESIKAIKEQTDAELEVFVHGALCVAYSGQCLLSSMIGGRSGNRGLCAQPCRMPYQLVGADGSEYESADGPYLLSTRDLNMLHHLPDLIASGVSSLKIEGRMKRPEYVATVVRHYRQAIDACYRRTGFDKKLADKELLLYNSRGEEIAGKVREMSIKGKAIETGYPGQIVMLSVSGNAAGAKQFYRTADVQLLKQAEQSFARPSQPEKQVVHFKVELHEGQPISMLAWDDAGHQQYGESEYLVEQAKNRPSDYDSVYKQLDRLGNTAFALGDVVTEIDDGVIAPASELNQLRRVVIEALEEQLKDNDAEKEQLCSYDEYIEDVGDLLDRIPPQVMAYGLQQKLAVTVGSAEGVTSAADSGADIIYFNATALRREKVVAKEGYPALLQYCHDRRAQLFWTCSPIENDKQLAQMKPLMQAAKDAGFDGVMAGNLGLLQVAREMGWVTIVADYQMNIFNDVTLQYLSEQEISRAVLSPELSLEQISEFSYLGNLPLELIVHGNLPLMVSEQCVCGSVLGGRTAEQKCSMPCMKQLYYLKDRMDVHFPLYMDQNCRMHVFNSKTLNLYKRLDECLKTGADILRIEAREQDAQWIGEVTAIYKKAIDEYNRTGAFVTSLADLEQLDDLAPEGSTYGHYFRGVL